MSSDLRAVTGAYTFNKVLDKLMQTYLYSSGREPVLSNQL